MCPNKLWAANTSWPNYLSGIKTCGNIRGEKLSLVIFKTSTINDVM